MKSKEEKRTIKIVKAIDLIKRVEKEPEPTFIWKGIPEGSKGLIVGVGKTGKTTFAENLAIAIAIGNKECFGYPIDSKARKVLFINLEESYKLRTKRNIKQISILTDIEKELFYENYISTPEDFPEFMEGEEDWQHMRDYIIASEADIVIIDSLSHLISGKIEESSNAMAFIKRFRQYLGDLDKTYIVIHHNTKGNDKPIEMENIAGSRLISQEFEYAYGLGNIPNRDGGNYMCDLYNKHVEKDSTTAIIYKVNQNGWLENKGTRNKYDLYLENNNRSDGRIDDRNSETLLEFFFNQASQASQNISTSELMDKFVGTQIMSRDTLHKNLGKLIKNNKLIKQGKGFYILKEISSEELKKDE